MPLSNPHNRDKKKSTNGSHVRQIVIQVPVSSKNAGLVANAFRDLLIMQNNGPSACRFNIDKPCVGLRKGDFSLAVGYILNFNGKVPLESIYFDIDAGQTAFVSILEGAEDRE